MSSLRCRKADDIYFDPAYNDAENAADIMPFSRTCSKSIHSNDSQSRVLKI